MHKNRAKNFAKSNKKYIKRLTYVKAHDKV